ncbi:TIGR02444 family protein [Brevundimonas lutea]|uniref:TIGR02444 family protein n=1 Tax=Brevundimonas lutea TaxID=2293980 RepID=UPI001F0BC16D|nr:TIGR02444 family protein [Brevundimonas lutea]
MSFASANGSLWDWAVAAYGASGVQAASLMLQDTAGQSVPLLLWAAWTARTGRAVDDETMEAAVDTATAWTEAAVAPLRAVRVRLKAPLSDLEPEARERVRTEVKRVELMAEQALLADLEMLTDGAAGEPLSDDATLDRLVEAARAWNGRVPREGLKALRDRLPA